MKKTLLAIGIVGGTLYYLKKNNYNFMSVCSNTIIDDINKEGANKMKFFFPKKSE
jgi:hypothetical protein